MSNWFLVTFCAAILRLIWMFLDEVLCLIARHYQEHARRVERETAHGMGPWQRNEGTGNGAFAYSALVTTGESTRGER